MKKIIIVGLLSLLLKPFISFSSQGKTECTSVGPSGISGFWEILPKVKKIKHKKILCASGGCLATVTRDFDIHYVYNLANSIKYENISNQKKKNDFIKIITRQVKKIPDITVVTMDFFGNCYKDVPRNKTHLMELLVETSDVPYFTTRNPGRRIDGGLCFYKVDDCVTKIRSSFSFNVLLNLFNFNMSELELMELYNYNI